jgi:hypothetical protein
MRVATQGVVRALAGAPDGSAVRREAARRAGPILQRLITLDLLVRHLPISFDMQVKS